jgi:hypothetical protein
VFISKEENETGEDSENDEENEMMEDLSSELSDKAFKTYFRDSIQFCFRNSWKFSST